jgi:iron complex outermembrane receptor protein
MKTLIRFVVLTMFAGGHAPDALAQGTKPAPDLARATIEDLMNLQITSASRKEQRLGDVPAAVYVITQDDIRRSGMTTVPELLRLVPGVQVARINANKWAVSVRGFNGLYSNKLLVLVDGRSVYNRLFSGVLWDSEDVVLDDVDRIEVIRGPGGAVWGANAVNGVINIVTKTAADTKGALVRVGGGTFDSAQALARYGGSFGRTAYRVYSQWTAHGDSPLAPHVTADDDWRRATVGGRAEWTAGPRTFTLDARATRGQAKALWLNFDPAPSPNRPVVVDTASTMNGGTVLARWTHTRDSGASVQIQSVLDLDHRDEPVGNYHRRTGDVGLQYHAAVGARHDVVAGAGYRVMHEEFAGRNGYRLTPEASTDSLFNAFAQDEIAMAADRLHVTLGARAERDDLTGWGVQPTARVTWDVVPQRQRLWAATSRALRTPSLVERGVRLDYPPVPDADGPLPVRPSVLGSPDARSEEFADAEAGYRLTLGPVATIAVTGFVGRYQHLSTNEPLPPSVVFGSTGPYVSAPFVYANLLGANTKGLEIDAHWTPVSWWRLDAGYTAFQLMPHPDPASQDARAAIYDGDAPGQQWQLQSGLSLGRRAEANVAVFHVGALKGLGVPACTRADARFEWKLTGSLSAVAAGQNLFHRAHAEFTGTGANAIATTVPRSVRLQLRWRVSGS